MRPPKRLDRPLLAGFVDVQAAVLCHALDFCRVCRRAALLDCRIREQSAGGHAAEDFKKQRVPPLFPWYPIG